MENEVIKFINTFKYSHSNSSKSTEYFFSHGLCYYFAIILQTRFQSGVIMYDRSCQHFVCKIDDLLYDITGDVTDDHYEDDLVEWSEFENIDKQEYDAVHTSCVLLN